MGRRVKVGNEFNAEVKIGDISTRKTLTYSLLGVGTTFLIAAGLKGLVEGDFHTLNAVWDVEGPVVGLMTGYFYRLSQSS